MRQTLLLLLFLALILMPDTINALPFKEISTDNGLSMLAQYAGTTPSRAAREVKAVVQAVRANRRFARRSHRPAAAESPYAG